jgi:LysR family transcriptional regulator for metE and metH
VDIDIRPGLAFDALPALRREEVDLVVSSDPEDLPGVTFTPLFDYEPVLAVAGDHPWRPNLRFEASDLAAEPSSPIPWTAPASTPFTELLAPEGVEPRAVRQVETPP